MKKYLLHLSVAIGLSGCIEPIDIDVVPEAPRLVIYGALNPDSLVSVWVSQTKEVTDTARVQPVATATVQLSQDGQPPQLLALYDAERGEYRAAFAPEVNATYHLQVRAEGFPDVEATTRILEPTAIQSVTYEPVPTGLAPECDEDTCVAVYERYRIAVTWTDPNHQENYYEVGGSAYYYEALSRYDSVQDDYIPYSVERRQFRMQFFSDDPVLEEFRGPEDDFFRGLHFSDERFNGQRYTFQYEVEHTFSADQIGVVLSTLHPDLYRYERSKDGQRSSGLSRPDQVYQNIIGGYGIFSSVSRDTVMIDLN